MEYVWFLLFEERKKIFSQTIYLYELFKHMFPLQVLYLYWSGYGYKIKQTNKSESSQKFKHRSQNNFNFGGVGWWKWMSCLVWWHCSLSSSPAFLLQVSWPSLAPLLLPLFEIFASPPSPGSTVTSPLIIKIKKPYFLIMVPVLIILTT